MQETTTQRIAMGIDEVSGTYELFVDGILLLNTLTPVLFYADEFVGETTGNMTYTTSSRESGKDFEASPYFPGEYERITKIFSVQADGDSFEVSVHAILFPTRNCVYFYADVAGASAKFDKIAGYIDIGVPDSASAYRYFHGSDPREPATVPIEESTGIDLFSSQQQAFHDSGVSNAFPTNDRLRITYLMAQLSGAVAGFVPVNRFGQRALIRCCELPDLPAGIKFVSGTFMSNGTYEKMAGGLLSIHDDPVLLSRQAFETYMQLVNRPFVLRWYKEYPEMFEYLGFCTWNTFYRNVSYAKMETLCEKNFTAEKGSTRFKYLILDDGWQSTNEFPLDEANFLGKNFHGGNFLEDIRANFKFPEGLEPLNRLLKNRYGFKWWGVWHAIGGYWQGIDAAKMGKTYPAIASLGHNTPDPEGFRAYNFWADYYKYMRQAGVDMVKIDNQSSIGTCFDGIYPIDDAIEKYYLMMQGAAAGQNITMLNCMAQASDCKIHWTKSNVARVSGDFGPGNFLSMKEQVRQGVYQPLFFAQFCWPDHDMCQTVGPTDPLLLLHMVSGGPIYIADDIGSTNGTVCDKMSFKDGKLPRLDTPSMPTIDVIFKDSENEVASKAWSYHDLDGWGRIFYYYVANGMNFLAKVGEVNKLDQAVNFTVGVEDMGAARFAPTAETGKVPAEPWPASYVLADITTVPVPTSTPVRELAAGERTEPETLENWEVRYYCISPLVNGISLLGIDEIWNGTKAMASARWLDQATLEIAPVAGHGGTLRVYASSGVSVTASTSICVSIKVVSSEPVASTDGTILKIPIGDQALFLHVG
jgi:hypothetical protein